MFGLATTVQIRLSLVCIFLQLLWGQNSWESYFSTRTLVLNLVHLTKIAIIHLPLGGIRPCMHIFYIAACTV